MYSRPRTTSIDLVPVYTYQGDSIRALRVIQKLLDQPEALTDRQAPTIVDSQPEFTLNTQFSIDSEADREVETGREADTDTDTRNINREAETDRQMRQTDTCACMISCFVG